MKAKVVVGIQIFGNAFCEACCPYRDNKLQGFCYLRSHTKPDYLPIKKNKMELQKRTKYCIKNELQAGDIIWANG